MHSVEVHPSSRPSSDCAIMRYLFTLQNFSTVSYVNNAKEYFAKSNGVKCFFSEEEDGPPLFAKNIEDIVDYDTLSSFISEAYEVNYLAKALFFYKSPLESPCAWNFFCRENLKNNLLASEQEEELLHIVNSGRFSVIRVPLLTHDGKTLDKMNYQSKLIKFYPLSISTPRGYFHWTHFSQSPAYVTEVPAASLVIVGKDYRKAIKDDITKLRRRISTNGVNIDSTLIVCRSEDEKKKWSAVFGVVAELNTLSRDALTEPVYVATYLEIKELQKQSISKIILLKDVIKSEISVDMSDESLFFYLEDWSLRFPGFILPFTTLVWKAIVCDDCLPFFRTFPQVQWNSQAVFYLYVLKNGEKNIPSCDISLLYPYFFKTKIHKAMMYFFMYATCIFWKNRTLRPNTDMDNFFFSDSQGTKIESVIQELYNFKDSLEIPRDVLQRSIPNIFKSKKLAMCNEELLQITSSFFPHTNAETINYTYKSEPSAEFFKQTLESEKSCCVCYGQESLQISMCGHIMCMACLGMSHVYKVTPCPSCRSHLTWLDWFSCSQDGDTMMYGPPRVTAIRRLMCRRRKRKIIVLCKNSVVLENMQEWFSVYNVPCVKTDRITKDIVQIMTFNDLESIGLNETEEYHSLMVIIPTLQREQFSRFKFIQQVVESWAAPLSSMHVLGLKDGKYITCI